MLIVILGILGLGLLSFLGFASFVLCTENHQYKENSSFGFKQGSKDSKVLVAYFSRSKNTEVAAKALAQKTKGRLLKIVAKNYEIGIKGWVNANQDARKFHAVIEHEAVDLKRFDTLYIGSPIWWYSPAPPVWEFISSNSLEGLKVILFNTYNSKFEQSYIDAFADTVRSNGGDFVRHISVNRGRMTKQISQENLVDEIKSLVD